MHKLATLGLALSLFAIAPVGLATHDETDCEIGEPTGDVIDVGGAAYINVRGDPANGDIWVYAESNGVTGLQSGGTHALGYTDAVVTEDCGHGPDTLLF